MQRISINGMAYEAYDIALDAEGYPVRPWEKEMGYTEVYPTVTLSARMGIDRWEIPLYYCEKPIPFESDEERESFERFAMKEKTETKWAAYFLEGILLVFDREPNLMDVFDGFITAMKARHDT
jgi:hypothetical protein